MSIIVLRLLCSDVYGDGRGLCNTLWGQSFVYTDQSPSDPDRTCFSLYWPLNQTNPNLVAIRNIFGNQVVDTVAPPPCEEAAPLCDESGTGAAERGVHLSYVAVAVTAVLGVIKP